jgi:hypothetical protein
MPSDQDVIIISNYRTRVNYYGWFTVRAWVFLAAPGAALIVGLIVGAIAG